MFGKRRTSSKSESIRKESKPAISGYTLFREISGILLFLGAAFLTLALITYHPDDPNVNHLVGSSASVHNMGGVIGSYVSGVFVDIFGLAAFVFPPCMFIVALSCVSARCTMPWWRFLGFILLGLCAVFFGTEGITLFNVKGGGFFGTYFVCFFISQCGINISILLWLFLLFLSLELCFSISWLTILSYIFNISRKLLSNHRFSVKAMIQYIQFYVHKRKNSEQSIPSLSSLHKEDDDSVLILDDIVEEHHIEHKSNINIITNIPAHNLENLSADIDSTQKDEPLWIQNLSEEVSKNSYSDQEKADNLESLTESIMRVQDSFRRTNAGQKKENEKQNKYTKLKITDDTPLAQDNSSIVEENSAVKTDSAVQNTKSPLLESPFPPEKQESSLDSESFDKILNTETQKDASDAPHIEHKKASAGTVISRAVQSIVQAFVSCTLPSFDLLSPPTQADYPPTREFMRTRGEQLMACLNDFNVRAELVRVTPGPVITMFELRPAPGTKVSRILSLNEDIALNLKALSVRIHVMAGSDTVGVEIPNEIRATVNFRTVLKSNAFMKSNSFITLALGVNIGGEPVVADLSKMPHLLVGGTTGSGKSVCINAFLLSLLYKFTPDKLKLLLIDPKRVEMAMYSDLPHLIHPIVNEPAIAKNALDWAVHEMERRYEMLARLEVRKFDAYNEKLKSMGDNLPPEYADLAPMPYLVIIIDELADLMMSAGKEVESSIVRLAQLARAAGIHLIVATQRPSVDVVTGLIKANFPSRVSFRVANGHDSRTILDSQGAELLLGNGDMLFRSSGGKPIRLHGPFVPDSDVDNVVSFWKAQCKPEYTVDFAEWGQPSEDDSRRSSSKLSFGNSAEDDLYEEIVNFAVEHNKNLSISKLQRQFRIGFNKAARFMEQMQQDGIIPPPGHANRARDVINPNNV